MNFQFYLEKLYANKHFIEFREAEKTAYPCSCFFSVDKKGKDAKQHFDFYIPETKKLFSFKLESGGEKVPVEMLEDTTPNEIGLNYDFDFKEVEKLLLVKMEEGKIKGSIEKMLFSLQKVEGKELLVGTVFLSMMGLIQTHIDISEMKVIHFEKKSFFDMVKISGSAGKGEK
ncbi:hypothetical protein HOD88_00245 [archaeon]|jgi:hypothetical protein|nr:hypothetical protein [archaeon]